MLGSLHLPRGIACLTAAAVALVTLGLRAPASAQSLRGSSRSLDRQSRQAQLHDFTYLRRPGQLDRFVDAGWLVPVASTRDYLLSDVSFGVARPEVKLFLERFGAEYRRRCGERLVVTSLTRPTSLQPVNASGRSVHPTGMAVDLRRPAGPSCRAWFESRLMVLEHARVLEATRESTPPHYHVAIFPDAYTAFVKGRPGAGAAPRATSGRVAAAGDGPAVHRVRSGETLWRIARAHGTTVLAIQQANALSSSAIAAGRSLLLPPAIAR